MPRKPIPPRVLFALTALAALLFIALGVVLAVAAVLGAMGDAVGHAALNGVALGFGILLAVNLICLVLALGINGFSEGEGPPKP